jgi:DNA-binding GntR family transcriptional regulator
VNAALPSYLALADELEQFAARLPPGSRLPSEHDLVALHEVSRLTARAAVQELERRHLVRRVRGSGTFVARRIDYAVRSDMPPSWSETVRRAGGEPFRTVVGIGRVPAPLHVSRALDLPRGTRVVAVSRLGTVDGLVADIGTSWIPDDLVHDLDRFIDDGGSLYTALLRSGSLPRRRWITAELQTVPAEAAAQLELEGRPQVWRLESCNDDAVNGRPVEFAEGWLRPDVYRVRLHLGTRTGVDGR